MILLTGSNGFVGSALMQRMQALGRASEIKAVVRNPTLNPLPNVAESVVIKNIEADTDWRHALVNVDVVIHCAARVHVMRDLSADPLNAFRAVNVGGTLKLAQEAAAAGVKRFIFISSVKVNGESTEPGACFKIDDEMAPLDAYGVSKKEAELGLREIAARSGLEVVIIRPPLIYGAGVKANFARLVKLASTGLPLPLGAVHNARSLLYVKNLVDFLILCTHHPKAANEQFLLSDGEDVSTTRLLETLAQAQKTASRLVPVPVALLKAAMRLSGKADMAQRLLGNLQVDSSKARALLGWTPPYSFEAAVQDMFKP
jgi:nucleoside-diphosphate-sugar epimerase